MILQDVRETVNLTFQGGLVKVSLRRLRRGSAEPDDRVWFEKASARVWREAARSMPANKVLRQDGRVLALDVSKEVFDELQKRAWALAWQMKQAASEMKRGRIAGFSRKSRKRLLELVSRLNVGAAGLFLTFTYRENMTDHKKAKRHLDLLLRWLKRRFPESAILWRMEYQRRGAIHFHLIAFGADYVNLHDITAYWQRMTEDDSYPDVERITSRRKALNYVSKYIAKLPNADESEALVDGLDSVPYSEISEDGAWVGRYWGVVNRDKLPFAAAVVIAVTGRLAAFFDFKRAARRYYKRGIWRSRIQGFTLFVNDAERWFDLWLAICQDG